MTTELDTPAAVAQRQLDAYNAMDVDAWLATYASDAKQYEHPGKLLATGHDEMRARIAQRFAEPNLHARPIHRVVLGNTVVDHEEVSRSFPDGPGRIEMVCIYVIERGLIQTATFIFGAPVLE